MSLSAEREREARLRLADQIPADLFADCEVITDALDASRAQAKALLESEAEWQRRGDRALKAEAQAEALAEALVDLRTCVDSYVHDDVGIPELAESMDKAHAALAAYRKGLG